MSTILLTDSWSEMLTIRMRVLVPTGYPSTQPRKWALSRKKIQITAIYVNGWIPDKYQIETNMPVSVLLWDVTDEIQLHSDQDSNFQSDLFNSVCTLLEVTKTRTTPYHPASNGMIERINRILAGMIKSFINKNAPDWDVYINLVLAAYRSLPHPATAFSPNFLMLGRKENIRIRMKYPIPNLNECKIQHEYSIAFQDKLQEVYQITRKHLKANAERLRKNHDSRMTKYQYKKGDLVHKFDKTV